MLRAQGAFAQREGAPRKRLPARVPPARMLESPDVVIQHREPGVVAGEIPAQTKGAQDAPRAVVEAALVLVDDPEVVEERHLERGAAMARALEERERADDEPLGRIVASREPLAFTPLGEPPGSKPSEPAPHVLQIGRSVDIVRSRPPSATPASPRFP